MGIRLQQRDLRIIKAVNDCRALQIDHIEKMFFCSQSRAYDRVAKLVEHEYIDCLYLAQISTSPTASQRVFVTSKLGAQVLIDNYGYDISDIHFPGRQEKNWQHLKHLLSINYIRANVVAACEYVETLELLQWRDEAYFRSKKMLVSTKNQVKPLYPDGYCTIQSPQGSAHYFIEADNATEGHQQFKSQIEVYEAYTKSGQYQRDFNTTALRIIIITTSKRRLKNLVKAIQQVSNQDLYLLSTYSQLSCEDFFTGKIWYTVQQGKIVSLL